MVFGGRTLSAAGKGAAGVTGTAPFPDNRRPTTRPTSDRIRVRPPGRSSRRQRVNERTYSEGELPFWNPYQGSGTPQAANVQSAPFDPLLLVVNLHPTQRVWDLWIWGAFVLGALAAFVFARILGLFTVPAVVASAAYSLSGFFFLYSNNQFSRSYVYLPDPADTGRGHAPLSAVVAGLRIGGRRGGQPRRRHAGGIVVRAQRRRRVRSRPDHRPAKGRPDLRSPNRTSVGGGFLLGVAIASPLLLSFRQYEALSFNTHKESSGQGSQADPTWGLLNWVAPFFHGIKKAFSSPGVHEWCGGAVVVASLLAVQGVA